MPARSLSGWRANPSVTQFQDHLAKTHTNIGNLQLAMGRPTEALTSHEQAREILKRLASQHPESSEFASQVGGTSGTTWP